MGQSQALIERQLRGKCMGASCRNKGTKSVPSDAGEQSQIAVKVTDDRGNELMVVKKLSEAK